MLAQGFLRVKGQAEITKCYFLWVGAINMQSLSGHYLMRQQLPMVFLLFFSLSRYCCLHFCRNKFGLLLAQGYFTGQRSSIIHKLQLLWPSVICNCASNSGHSMIAYLLRQLTKSNILWFVLDLWPLKILVPTWTQIYFFQKCKQQYWDKLNEVKTPWVLVGAASSKHIKSAHRTAWTFIWPLIYCALALRKCLENYYKYWTNRTQTFFLFVLLELWFVYHFPCFLQFFDIGAQS